MVSLESLGLRSVINANATLTRLGGSRLAPGVAQAMALAGEHFLDIPELQAAVGREIARLTGNEAAYVSCGAAAALTLTAAACIAGQDPALRERLPDTSGLRSEIIVHRRTRVGYDFALRMAGASLVEIGREGARTTAEELREAIGPRTAAMFYFPRHHEDRGEIPLETAVDVCADRGVPVIVDAAAQLPPRSNLRDFTRRGAAAAIFSGGKGLRGPQTTGLVLGRQWVVDGCAFHGPPNPFIGRGMKVGKEELLGILAAVRWYLSVDEAAEAAFFEDAVAQVIAGMDGIPGIAVSRSWPSEAGQPVPRAEIVLHSGSAEEASRALLAGDPAIEVAVHGNRLLINPQTLDAAEIPPLIRRLREVLSCSPGSGT